MRSRRAMVSSRCVAEGGGGEGGDDDRYCHTTSTPFVNANQPLGRLLVLNHSRRVGQSTPDIVGRMCGVLNAFARPAQW